MILVFGIDGFGWNWRELITARGFSARPMFSPHAMSGPAWTSILTGLKAESHGINNHQVVDEIADRLRPRYLWDHLAANGKEAVIINAPFTWPPPMTRRLLVSGYPCRAGKHVYPASKADNWPVRDIDIFLRHFQQGESASIDTADEVLFEEAKEGRWSVAHRVRLELEEGQPDVLFIGNTDLDRLGHGAAGMFADESRRVELLNDILDVVDRMESVLYPTCTLIVSDHGLDTTAALNGEWWHTHGPDLPETRQAIFAWRGAKLAIPEGETVQLEDVTPTLLGLLDAVPISALEGRAWPVAISEADMAELSQQLQGLGYM